MQSIQTSKILSFNFKSKSKHVLVYSRMGELDRTNRCLVCGMEYQTFKEAIECCVDIE